MPDFFHIDVAAGSLGHGLANARGMVLGLSLFDSHAVPLWVRYRSVSVVMRWRRHIGSS